MAAVAEGAEVAALPGVMTLNTCCGTVRISSGGSCRGGSGLPGSFIFLLAAVVIAVAAFFAFTFRVDPDELGIVMRFGKPVRSEPPGLHFCQPYPIEEVRLPKVTRRNIIEVGMRSSEVSPGGLRVPEESLMLTGDENIVDIKFCCVLAHQERNEIPLQHPEAGGHREGGG
jgi:hypothetical protein